MHAQHDEPRTTAGPVRWVFFDAVGTLIEPHPPVHVVYARIARRFAVRVAESGIKRRFARAVRAAFEATAAVSEPLRSTPDPPAPPPQPAVPRRPRPAAAVAGVSAHGEEPLPRVPPAFLELHTDEKLERRRWRWIVAHTLQLPENHPAFDPLFEALWTHFGRPDAWRAFEDVAATLAELARAGYSLGAASNFDGRLHAVCGGLAALKPLRVVLASTDLGVRKPSTAFFHGITRRVSCPPEEIAYVGDDLYDDVRPATAAGMSAVWLVRSAEPGSATAPGTTTAPGSAAESRSATEPGTVAEPGTPATFDRPAIAPPQIQSLRQLREYLA